ncbi:MAG: IS607 family transposase [Lachnospiraceae bacterium]|nr:IS607 family transposase [Lachnospiraceae bacterium]MCM1233881.1 IS607 family transposase [Ruminococcus flavefaciens]
MKYYTIHEVTELLGVSAQTLRNWDKSGKLKPHHKSANGYRYYAQDDLNMLLGVKSQTGKTVGYCRVSSSKQKDDLERQEENMRTYLLAQGQPFEIISDIGSGINYKRKGLQELIKGMANRSIAKVVVLYKDRLTRFGFELIEYIAELYGCEIEIVDTTEKTEQEELVEDLVQIITVFSCKLQGKRANKAKKMIKELTEND